MSYDELRTLSFRLKEGIKLQHNFQILNLPGKSELLQLQSELSGRPLDRTTIPISLLNKAMRALVPDLIYIAANAGRSGETPWLYSETAINPQALYLILNAWVQTQFSRASDARKRQVLEQLQPAQLYWRPTQVNTAKWTVGDNGTANLGNDDQFILLPYILAAQFSSPDVSLRFGSETLHFRRAPLPPGIKGAEIVSWKPLEYEGWYWSVVITFTVQTVPFQNFPVIHADISLRRWESKPITYLPRNKETSVYLLTSVPWLEGLHNSQSFQVAPIGWGRLPSSQTEQGNSQYGWTWGSNLTALLDRLNRQHPFPTPQNIVDDPASALNLNDHPNAALVYRNGIKPAHEVEPGFGPVDRRELAEQIAELLQSEWEFVAAPERVKYSPKIPINPFLPDTTAKKLNSEEEFQNQRCHAISKTIGEQLTVEIWYQRSSTRDTLIHTLRQFLGISELESFPYKFPNVNLTLNIQEYNLGELGDVLQLDKSITNKIEQRREAITQRCEEVEAKVPQASCVTVAFIELDGPDKFAENADPKDALRMGFAVKESWTQFISTDNTGNLSHRAKNGFLDLLRQLGVQAQPPKIVITIPHSSQQMIATPPQVTQKALPEKLNYVALWMIKHNSSTSSDGSIQRVPVMVHMSSDTTEIKAIAPGLGNTWLPYREALLKIGQGEVENYQRQEEAVMRFIKPKLKDVLSLGDTLLLCHAQNIRSVWKWLQNGNITLDKIAFGEEKPLDISRFHSNKLRIVRVRDSQNHETPEWYAQKDGDGHGFSEGIFKMGERVFASTYNTPKQFQLNRNLSKASSWTSISRKTKEEKIYDASPDVYYWNPGLVELTVACIQPNDDPILWAAVTHELRHLALHYDEPLKLPWPLHLARLMEDYVLLLEDYEEIVS
ncbi:DUF3962 domain-containing protein [Nostoc sp. CENA67]|uniref:DUF3962 domain-containing protein n=1 Tax=Amazonocrinis nigriterrae CENA67 TaxID=2794033 RepID=A0A8J7HWE6_9NOST|nr:DUF3962 domain-containing protein [Amazonocrinis nigriterrae]MBH8567147.1 DUF3962 domain-containing protein [Amazonocrinis nigriterrae CENA67]